MAAALVAMAFLFPLLSPPLPAIQPAPVHPTAVANDTTAYDAHLTTYVIASGDGVARIAERFGIAEQHLRAVNPALDRCAMEVGDVILAPAFGPVAKTFEERSREIRRGIRGFGRTAITFDAGADVGALDILLGELSHYAVRGSFFITGRWVERHPEAFRRIVDAGHETFSHSYTHREFTPLSAAEIFRELNRTEDIFQQTAGRTSQPYFRPPFGERDERVRRLMAMGGWQCVYWTLDSHDSVGPPKTVADLVRRILEPPVQEPPGEFLDGAILLFHSAEPATARAVGPIINGLRLIGLEPVTLSEALNPPRY